MKELFAWAPLPSGAGAGMLITQGAGGPTVQAEAQTTNEHRG